MPELNQRLNSHGGANREYGEIWGKPMEHFVDLPPDTMREILRYGSKFVEAGAGMGCNGAMLEEKGADVLYYDAYPPNRTENGYFPRIRGLSTVADLETLTKRC